MAEETSAAPQQRDAHQPVAPRQAAAASFLGSLTEYYDYTVYGTAAALVLGQLFFSGLSPAVGSAVALGTFAAGFLVRPIGAVVFGHVGDRYGRRTALAGTILLMGVSTVLIGLLPTNATLGGAAAVLLIVLRLLQGIAVGGELGGASVLAVEHAPATRRGFFGSFATTGAFAGLVLASAVFGLLSLMSEEAFLGWGWRIPFLLSAVVVAVGLWVRLGLAESPHFRTEAPVRVARPPIAEVLRRHFPKVAIVTLIWAGPTTAYYLVTVYSLSYLAQNSDIPRASVLNALSVAALILCIVCPLWGAVSDRLGNRKRMLAAGAVLESLLVFLLFWTFGVDSIWVIFVAIVLVLGLGHAMVNGVAPAFFVELFPVEVRMTAVSLGQTLGSTVGGLAPIVAAGLGGLGSLYPVAAYSLALCVIGAIALLSVQDRTPGRPVAGEHPTDHGAAGPLSADRRG